PSWVSIISSTKTPTSGRLKSRTPMARFTWTWKPATRGGNERPIAGAAAARGDRATGAPQRNVFLTAEWRHLLMVNYVIDPRDLAALVPTGTELDLWHDQALVSLVGF